MHIIAYNMPQYIEVIPYVCRPTYSMTNIFQKISNNGRVNVTRVFLQWRSFFYEVYIGSLDDTETEGVFPVGTSLYDRHASMVPAHMAC